MIRPMIEFAVLTGIMAASTFAVSTINTDPNAPLTEDEVRALVQEVGLPDYFVKIAWCESRYKPRVTNQNSDKYKSADHGLFQINDHWWSHLIVGKDLYDPLVNARIAKTIYDAEGPKMWVCYNKLVAKGVIQDV